MPGSSVRVMSGIWKALAQLNPNRVKAESERGICVALVGPERLIKDAAQFLIGNDPEDYDRAANTLLLAPTPVSDQDRNALKLCDIVLHTPDAADQLAGVDPERRFQLSSIADMPQLMERIVKVPFLGYTHLPLARALPGFRPEITRQIIQTISIENALFVLSTSLGNVIPNPLQALTSLAASAGDLVVLTANQVRMTFQLAAAHNREPGYRHQSPEMASLLGAAFGWRSIARELVGAIPFGGGIIPKAAIAFAGTWAVGDGVAYYYATGKRMSKEEVRQRFDEAYSRGKATAETLFAGIKEAYSKLSDKQEQKGLPHSEEDTM